MYLQPYITDSISLVLPPLGDMSYTKETLFQTTEEAINFVVQTEPMPNAINIITF